jgi:dihydrolipoamide dehydrogenase
VSDEFDVVVIGAGPPGENAAGRAVERGFSVAIVESNLVGGTCSFWGCIPSKALVRPGDVLAAARRVPGAEPAVTGGVDAPAAFGWRDYMTSSWSDETQTPWLDEMGIELVRGHGRLDGERRVVVETDAGMRTLKANRAVVLACGAHAVIPPIEGLADVRPWTNKEATEASTVPERFLVLGGGPIGTELAQAFRQLGSQAVTVVEGSDRLLPREEPFAGEQVAEAFAELGIDVRTGVKATAAHRDGDGVHLSLDDGATLHGDEILVAVGRRANTGDVGLETVGLEPGKAISVDDRLRVQGVEGEWLYSVGDVSGGAQLTHVGKYQGRIFGDVLAGRDVADEVDGRVVPRVTFTDPQGAAVGPTEAEVRERGIDVKVVQVDTGGVAGASLRGDGIHGTSQLVVDREREVVVGATFTGPDVQELVHAATIAIVGEVPLRRLWHAVPAFPTVSEVWLRLLEAYGV